MPHPCPRPCGRLATAAVFVSVGVIQFIAGLILLKSKYVSLLSGPDFWTAASNLAVGILLGMSASVWKDIQKASSKHAVRRNILASLVASAMIINSTTAIILILGEANALLSISLENDGESYSTSEILAYSYATSVCSPIVSVVVAIVFLSGMWFRVREKGVKTPEIKSILKKDGINEYNWVFKGRQSPPKRESKTLRKELSFKSLSSSSDDEYFSLTDAKLWSNSVNSIEYLNTSSRKGYYSVHRHSQVHQESACESGEYAKNNFESIPHETSRVSFADNTKTGKFLKFSPYASQSLLETDGSFYSGDIKEEVKKASSRSYSEFKKMHRHIENSKQRYKKKRMLLTEHPAFQQSKFFKAYMDVESSKKLESPDFYIPRAHSRVAKPSITSEVKADVHVEPESQDWVVYENTSESPIVHCEGDVHSCDGLRETQKYTALQHKNLQFSRSSTFKQIKSPREPPSVDRKVCRTSTAAGPSSSKISQLDISNIQNDSVIDQNEHYDSEEEKDISAAASPQPATWQMDSNIEIDDSFIDGPQSNALAGEVVKVHINSLPRKQFHSKLIPVPIPIISSVKKKTLKRQQKDPISPDKFSDRSELRFSSFHGDLKEMNQGSPHINADRISPDDSIPASPARTSGYGSAIFENTHLSGSVCFKPHLSSSETIGPYYTPKRKLQSSPFPRNLNPHGIEVE